MKAAWDRWVDAQEEEVYQGNTTAGAWLVGLLTIVVFLLIMTYIPPIQRWTGLSFQPAFLSFLPAFFIGMGGGVFFHPYTKPQYSVASLGTSTGIFFFCSSLVALASPQSKFIFVSLFLFAALFYGQSLRVTWQEPFILIGILVAHLCSLFIDHSDATLASHGITVPLGIFICASTGKWTLTADRQRKEKEQLKDALMAQIQNEQMARIDQMRFALIDVLAANHDLSNQIGQIKINIELLEGDFRGVEGHEETHDMLLEAFNGVKILQKLITEAKERGKQLNEAKKELKPTILQPILDQVCKKTHTLFPKVEIHSELKPEGLSVHMANGDLTLHRILENMVFNACQGDGKQGATQIDIKAHPGVSGETAILTIRDNGPGFPSSMLEKQHVDAFFTTKDEGTGLGLFTTERWVMASGGKLKLSNREEGGAQVEIILPQWA